MRRIVAATVAAAAVVGCAPSSGDDGRRPRSLPSHARSAHPSAPSGRHSAPPRPRRPRDSVVVYQLRKGRNAYSKDAYAPSPRPAGGVRATAELLRVALDELVRGPTPAERRAGYDSAFTRETADLVVRVEIRGRRAVIDFRDFRRERPEWGTSYGGSVFLMQLSQTVFQFDRVRSALYRIGRSCRRFWTFLESRCQTVRRRGPRGNGVVRG